MNAKYREDNEWKVDFSERKGSQRRERSEVKLREQRRRRTQEKRGCDKRTQEFWG